MNVHPPGPVVVFTTLAMNQTLFFEALARALEAHGVRPAHIAFHERSHDYLVSKGMRSFNAFELGAGGDAIDWEALGIANPAFLLSHEKAAFEIADTRRLLDKFAGYARAVTTAIDRLQAEGDKLCVVQELGGFTSILATFYAARARNIDNWFLEPSFFRGRVLFVRNSLAALPIGGPTGAPPTQELREYLNAAVLQQSTVVPRKDAHHYRTPWRKILDARHIRRLVEKATDKYLLGKREEFGHIGGHVFRHARMVGKSALLQRHYTQLEGIGPFVYYPLHVPADVAITLRAPHYLDQYALIDYLCRITPLPYKLVIKEHPALVGAVDYGRVRELLRTRDNLVLLEPKINNYRVLREASAIVTINSKSGAEALLLGRPVLVLGDAFYRTSTLVTAVDQLQSLEGKLRDTLNKPPTLSEGAVMGYFQDVWDRTFPGELYVTDTDNIARFTRALMQTVVESKVAAPA
jgi:hypothetical protein